MRAPWTERWLDNLIGYGICLPMTLTQRSRSPWVRVLGFLLLFPWAPVAGVLSVLPLLALMFCDLLRMSYRGEI